MKADPIIARFRTLSAAEKIRLVQQLWDEVADEATRLPLTDSQRRWLDERIDDHQQKPEDVESWEAVREQILREL